MKKTSFYSEEGCDLFHPTLTTKGFCYTFNGNTPYETWKTAEIINVFNDLFPAHHSNEQFYGPVKEQGDIFFTHNQVECMEMIWSVIVNAESMKGFSVAILSVLHSHFYKKNLKI